MAVDLALKKAQDLNRKFFLVAGGQPRSTFYIQPNASAVIKEAAKQLAETVKHASGAEIPVVEANFDEVQTKNAVFLAEVDNYPVLREWFPYETNFVHGEGDGFAVRTREGNCYIFGERAAAVFFGAMDMIEQSTDVIWLYGMLGEEEIVGKQKNIYAFCNYYNKAYFHLRVWQFDEKEGSCAELASRTFAKNKINGVLGGSEGKYASCGVCSTAKLSSSAVYEKWQSFDGRRGARPNIYGLRDNLREYYRQGVKEICLASEDLRRFGNEMYDWIAAKLLWNFDSNIFTLRSSFCNAVYGNASKEMLQYYDLLEQGYEGENACSLTFLDGLKTALEGALKKELTPPQRKKIQAIYEEALFLK